MFSSLRQNSLLYILDKNNKPTLKIGQVVSTNNNQYYGTLNQNIDISVKIDNEVIDLKQLPSNLNIANSNDDPNIIVSESKEAMCTEVESMLKTSKQILDSVDYHKGVISSCEDIIVQLNPRIAKEKEQELKINNLEDKVKNIESNILDVKTMMSELLNKK